MRLRASPFELRDYQTDAVLKLLMFLDRRPILVAPTGAGKTVMGVAAVKSALDAGWSVLWLAHRIELIEQSARQLEALGLQVGIIMSGYAPTPSAQVQVASVHTLARRTIPDAQLIVIDECHHATADTYRLILRARAESYVTGLTATPFRLDGKGLGDIFGELVIAASTAELCERGILHKPKVWCSKAPDLRGLKVIAGDYALGDLARRTNTGELCGDIVATWQKRAAGKRTVVFAVNVEHSLAIRDAFRRRRHPRRAYRRGHATRGAGRHPRAASRWRNARRLQLPGAHRGLGLAGARMRRHRPAHRLAMPAPANDRPDHAGIGEEDGRDRPGSCRQPPRPRPRDPPAQLLTRPGREDRIERAAWPAAVWRVRAAL